MRSLSLTVLSIILLGSLISFTSAYSADSNYYCCFDASSGVITTKPGGCGNSIELKHYNGERCEDTYPKAYCQIGGVCYKALKNGTGEVFLRSNVVDSKNLCSNFGGVLVDPSSCTSFSFEPFSSSSSSTSYAEIGGSSSSSPGTVVGESPPPTAYVNVSPSEVSRLSEFCSNAGGPFGLFYNKGVCDSNVNCVYSPFSLGMIGFDESHDYFGKNFDLVGSEGKVENLYSCKSIVGINSCFDYKDKSSCDSNPSAGHLYAPNLKDCTWIPRSKYFNLINLNGGICISDFTHFTKFFNYDKIDQKENLVVNPSFESFFRSGVPSSLSLGTVSSIESVGFKERFVRKPFEGEIPIGWDVREGRVVRDEFAFDRTHSLELFPGGSVSQRIYYLNGKSTTYFLSFYIKNNLNFSDNDFVSISLIMYGSNGTEIGRIVDSRDLRSFEGKDIYTSFSKIPSFIVKEGTTSVKLIIKNDAHLPIYIDAVSFSYNNINSPIASPGHFTESPEIPPDASNCNKCFVKEGFNDCTFKKSSLLGDCYYTVPSLEKNYKETLIKNLGDLSHYSGFNSNPLLSTPWIAQSVPNSIMFCEMYNNKHDCLSKKSYVNRVYSKFFPGATNGVICNWNDKIGCYLDSTGKGVPSYFLGRGFEKASEVGNWDSKGADFRKRTLLFFNQISILRDAIENYYNYGDASSGYAEGDGVTPDFVYGCDMVPPIGSFFFSFENNTGGIVYVGKGSSYRSTQDLSGKILGNGVIHLSFYDRHDPQCDYLSKKGLPSLSKKIFVMYEVNGEAPFSGFWEFDNSVDRNFNLSQFFIDKEGHSLLKDGVNKIKLMVFDQSGNINWISNYKFNLDLNPPLVDILLNRSKITNLVNGKDLRVYNGDRITISVRDHSLLKSCRYWLDPIGDVNLNYYNSSIHNIFVNGTSTKIEFPIIGTLIYNTSVAGDSYAFWVSCTDVFGHTNKTFVMLTTDLKTDFLLLAPNDFIRYDRSSGFLNSSSSYFLGASSDSKISSCKVVVGNTSTDGVIYNNLDDLKSKNPILYSLQLPSYEKYIFFNMSPLKEKGGLVEGRNSIKFSCKDVDGGVIKEIHVFYYDTKAPKVIRLRILNKNVTFDGKVYVVSNEPSLEADIDGTYSWIKDVRGEMKDESGKSIGINLFKRISISNSSFIGNVTLRPEVTSLTYGVDRGNGLYERDYVFDFVDSAGNILNKSFTYFYDSNKPFLNFSGDVKKIGNKLYTSKGDPEIKLGFDTPAYRKYECNLSVYFGYVNYGPFSLSKGALVDFKIGDYIDGFNVSKGDVKVSLSCVDDFGVKVSGNYDLVYDSFKPKISLSAVPKSKYYKIGNGVAYSEFLSNLYLNLENHEDYLSCSYWFEPGVGVTCNGSHFEWSSISPSSTQLIGRNLSIAFGRNSICTVSPGVGVRKIKVNVKCRDAAGLVSNASTTLDVGFSDKFLVGLNFNYTRKAVVALLKTVLNPSLSPNLFLMKDGEVLGKFTYVNDYDGYQYGLSLPIDSMDEGEYNVVAGLYSQANSSSLPIETISGRFKVDKTPPAINISILNGVTENSSLVVYGNTFNMEFEVSDRIGTNSTSPIGLKDIQIILDNGTNEVLLWNMTARGMWYNSKYVSKPVLFGDYNYFRRGMNTFKGFLNVRNLSYDKGYKLIVKSEDLMFNEGMAATDFKVKDGLVLFVEDSNNAFADTLNNWFTSVDQPVLKFKTSNPATCEIKPFYDVYYGSLDDSFSVGSDSTEFVFNTSSLVSSSKLVFNASLKNNWLIKISCKYDSKGVTKVQDFYVYLNYIPYRPDYVMIPKGSRVISSSSELVKKVVFENKHDYPPIHCVYGFDPNSLVNNVGASNNFYNSITDELDFSGLQDGNITVYYECYDKTGRGGFIKNLTFVKNINSEFEIYDLEFLSSKRLIRPSLVNGKEYLYLSNSELGSDLEMKFRTTKTNLAVGCDYDIIGDSIFDKILSFVGTLAFNYGYESVKPKAGDYFEFDESNIKVKDGDIVKITCYDNNLNEVTKNVYVTLLPPNSINYSIRFY